MQEQDDDHQNDVELLKIIERNLVALEQELAVSSPLTHSDEEHDFLIKKVIEFRRVYGILIQQVNLQKPY
jgi:hypothetical protein